MASDGNGLYICPYDNSHRVQWLKLPNHLVKCRRNNPVLAKKMTICHYNYCHHVPKEELEEHLRNCKESVAFQKPYSPDPQSERPSLQPRQNVNANVAMDQRQECSSNHNDMNKNVQNPSSSVESEVDKPVDTLEEGRAHLRYTANRKLFEKLLPSDCEEARVQNQRNLDDLDEWYAE
ncbi:unnamed protein product [Orchesella dallaii]|uniref:CHHC U11-48K-type domain-containing protein n=1 Tax=Orchesella dallaii TaxID=48710 RepID=A0ABP1QTZ6_9HEXA